jgi:hypothetical protein
LAGLYWQTSTTTLQRVPFAELDIVELSRVSRKRCTSCLLFFRPVFKLTPMLRFDCYFGVPLPLGLLPGQVADEACTRFHHESVHEKRGEREHPSSAYPHVANPITHECGFTFHKGRSHTLLSPRNTRKYTIPFCWFDHPLLPLTHFRRGRTRATVPHSISKRCATDFAVVPSSPPSSALICRASYRLFFPRLLREPPSRPSVQNQDSDCTNSSSRTDPFIEDARGSWDNLWPWQRSDEAQSHPSYCGAWMSLGPGSKNVRLEA